MTDPAPLTNRLAMIVEDLCRAVAAHAGRNRAAAPLVLVLWPYLKRLAARFERLLARWQAGRIAPASPRGTRPRAAEPALPRPNKLPHDFGWLRRLVWEAGAYGSQLSFLLAEPAMAEMLAALPQARRILRPLCRMLGLDPDPLPPAPYRPRAATPSPGQDMPRSLPAEPAEPSALSSIVPGGRRAATA